MSQFNILKASIKQAIKQNGNGEITGNILQTTILSIINALLGGSGITNRMYRGLATPKTNPGSYTDEQVFYIASKPGNYVNFSNLSTTAIKADNKIHIIYNDINSNDWFEEALDLVEFMPILKALNLIGNTTVSIGTYNNVEGENAINSLAIGAGNIIGNSCCLANGYNTKASGSNSHAEGSNSRAIGDGSHAEGNNSKASGTSSHAEGTSTTSSGVSSHVEGYKTEASGESSHAEGSNSRAIGNNSHVEGNNSKALGTSSHAEGTGCVAGGSASHAGGLNTSINESGYNSFAHGNSIIVKTANTACVGTYNFYEFSENIKPRFIIGIGASNETRCNALVILDNGNMFIKGIGGYEGQNITNSMKPLQNIIHV